MARFETDDQVEIKRLSKAHDMAMFISQLKEMMVDKEVIKCEYVFDVLYDNGIIIDDILE